MSREIRLSRVLHPDIKDKSERKGAVNGTPEICSSWPSGEILSLLEIRIILSAGKGREKNKLLKNYHCAAFVLAKKMTFEWTQLLLLLLPCCEAPKFAILGKKIFAKYIVKSFLPSLQAGCYYGGMSESCESIFSLLFSLFLFCFLPPRKLLNPRMSMKAKSWLWNFQPIPEICSNRGKKRRLFHSGIVYSSSKDRNDAIWLRWLITQLEE